MTTEAKVGAFVIASVLILASATYFVHTTQTVRGQVPYKIHLRYAGGLAPGATVLFGGIKVGQVTAVQPWSEDPTRIEIVFAVKSGTPVNQKSTARVGTVSVMSTPALMMTTGNNEAPRLSAGAVVPSAESLSLEEIEGRVAKVAESADALMTELRREIPALTGDARTFLANLNQISGVQNQKRIGQILANLRRRKLRAAGGRDGVAHRRRRPGDQRDHRRRADRDLRHLPRRFGEPDESGYKPMINRIIDFSVRNKFLVLLLVGAAVLAGAHALRPRAACTSSSDCGAPVASRVVRSS
jgi:hypothetical protein